MVLGALWCPKDKTKDLLLKIRDVKKSNGLNNHFEIKWTKVSPAKQNFYLELVNFFFDEGDLCFRGLIIPDKNLLDHDKFDQDHDLWYYKMHFTMLKAILHPTDIYNVYLDIKDTRSGEKIRKLHDALCNSMYDFNKEIIKKVQTVHSHEIELLQMTDLLIGAIAYVNRNFETSSAKNEIVKLIRKRSNYSLLKTTLLKEEKFNLFVWNPKEIF